MGAVAALALLSVGCYGPAGVVDAAFGATSGDGAIRVTGWAFDRDTTDPIAVHIYVDDLPVAATWANLPRPDVAAAVEGAHPATGYDTTVPAAPGERHVCAYGIDAAGGEPNALLGCRFVHVGATVWPIDDRYRAAALTHTSTETTALTVAGADTVVTAAASAADPNIRFVFWPTGAARTVDQESCATWSAESGPLAQEGVALRVNTDLGATRAITVTKNVFNGVTDIFNVHLWDSAEEPGTFHQLSSTSLAGAFDAGGRLSPLPWTLCARVAGQTLTFKAWPAARAEPAWGDPAFGATVALPPEAPASGVAGWYAGHLSAGQSIVYCGLSARAL